MTTSFSFHTALSFVCRLAIASCITLVTCTAVASRIAPDPQGYSEANLHSFNRYAYANNNPYRYVDPDGNTPIDIAFLAYDIGKLGIAIYSNVGIGAAVTDVVLSAVGVVSPIPGTGQAIKAAKAVDRAVDVGRGVEHGASSVISKATKESAEAAGSYSKYTPGGKFSKSTKDEAAERANFKCEYCGVETSVAKKSERGVTPLKSEAQTDHIVPKSQGGTNSPSNAAHSCRDCNRNMSDTIKSSPRAN